MAFSMKGKNIIITGGSKGIGQAITRAFAQEAGNVIFTARKKEEGEALAHELREEGYSVEFFQADALDFDRTKELFRHAKDRLGSIDVLVLNAGIYPEQRLEDMTLEAWDRVLDVNLKSIMVASREALAYMKDQDQARIVAVSSITGNRVGNPGLAHYSASKAGLNGFMRTAALEMAKYNITFNAVEPGNIMTPGMREVLGPDYIKNQEASIPSGRLGRPEDIAYGIIFLASDEASYITGQSLIIDGGQTLPESAQDIG